MRWDEVRQLILDDVAKLGSGEELDSDAQFAERAGCSVPTVKRAMADLAGRGLVDRRRGRRTTCAEPTALISGNEFSFTRSARRAHGQTLVTQLIEKSCRLPNREPPAEFELRAHRALGLKHNQPFLVIARRRILDGTPRVIHRSYLNTDHYPATFLASHDFERQSLLEIIEAQGLRAHSRDTRIRAALPTEMDSVLLEIGSEPVLKVEQILYALSPSTGQVVTAEYLHATYAGWEYVVSDRK